MSAGNYRIKPSTSLPWSQTAIQKIDQKKKRNKNIIYPIFHELLKVDVHNDGEVLIDDFWKQMLENAGYGKFPRGFSYKDPQLSYRKGNKVATMNIIVGNFNNSLEWLAFELIEFMRKNEYKSVRDRELEQEKLERMISDSLAKGEIKWTDINKKKKTKKILIGFYTSLMAEKYNMTKEEKIEFSSFIHLGFFQGYLDNNDVNFEKGRILNINGIIFDPVTRQTNFSDERIPKKVKTLSEIKPPPFKSSFLSDWQKNIKDISKSTLLGSAYSPTTTMSMKFSTPTPTIESPEVII